MATALSQFDFQVIFKAIVQETREGTPVKISGGASITPADLASGTAADQQDLWMQDTGRAVTSGNTDDIDVFDWAQTNSGPGAGRDLIGNPLSVVEITGILIFNRTTSVGNITVGNNNTPAAWNSLFNGTDTGAWGPRGPGAIFFSFDPTKPALAVADMTNHLLTIAATGGDITYDIYMAGRSA